MYFIGYQMQAIMNKFNMIFQRKFAMKLRAPYYGMRFFMLILNKVIRYNA